jgi:hypothetical protein
MAFITEVIILNALSIAKTVRIFSAPFALLAEIKMQENTRK